MDNNQEPEKIEILSTDDEKIKSYGELLSNESSRTILQSLFHEELTAQEISEKALISLQLVKYHLNKMQELGVISVSRIGKNAKAHDMKYYKATNFAIVVVPPIVSDKAKQSKMLTRSFKTIYRFVGISIAGIITWFSTSSLQDYNKTVSDMGRGDVEIPVSTGFAEEFLLPIIITSVVVGGLIIEKIIRMKRNKPR